mmetsp:Transcript_2530/g.3876  ORF Transcript_2530/g.3876 Transcript_2530/m.3876 type:complete len:83 (-) Transcript_2530:152-400(-)
MQQVFRQTSAAAPIFSSKAIVAENAENLHQNSISFPFLVPFPQEAARSSSYPHYKTVATLDYHARAVENADERAVENDTAFR